MRTIAIVNQKGGCGKTTTAINLAAVLARRGHRTLLVDMDPQSHCAAGLGVPESSIVRGVGEVLLGDLDRPLDSESFLWEVSRHLHLAPSTVSLAALEAAAGGLSSLPDRDRRLARMLAWLAPRFDLCIVDCPPTIGLLTFNALRAADEALVPVETGYFSLRGAEKQIATIVRTVERLGRPLPFRLLATLFDESRPVDRSVLEQLRKRYGEAVLPLVVGDHEVLREAASVGQAVTEFAPHSAADRDFESLAAWLVDHPPASRNVASGGPSTTPAVDVQVRAVQPDQLTPQPRFSQQPQPSAGAAAFRPRSLHELAGDRAMASAPHPPAEAPSQTPVGWQVGSTRAAELARRVRDLSAKPTAEELAMLERPVEPRSQRGPAALPAPSATVRLVVPRGMAFRVGVRGDFNHWQTLDLTLRPDSGVFEANLSLAPGRYRYRLVVDGREALDPTNPERELGPDGRDVSVLTVLRSAASLDGPAGRDVLGHRDSAGEGVGQA
jgi:chromosome partitioning protein